MASYTIRSAASSGIYAKLVLTEQSQSVANNTTTLSWQLYMWNTQAKPNWYAYEEHNIVQISINGQYVLNTDDFGMISLQYEQTESSAKLIASDTITIAHGSNGSKTIAASFYVEQGWYGAYKWSGSNSNIALTAIARASKPSLSVSSLTFGGSVTIYTNRASDGFMHTLTYSIGSASGTIGTAKGIGASYPWTPSKDLAKQFPNESKGRVTITCTTYNGSTPIGDPISIELELVVSSDMVPTITSVTLTEVGQSVFSHSSVGGYIQSKSKLQYTVNVDTSTAYGATVSSYQVKINGGTYNKSSDTTGYLNTTGTNTVVATIIDSRGNPVTYDKTTFNVVSYSPPRIDYINAFRANSSGVSDEDGSYLMVELTNTITSLGGANGRSVTIETRQSNSSTWTPRNVFVSDGYVGFNCWTYGGDVWADPSLSYEVRVQVSDSFGSSTYYTSISTASTCINIRPNKDGIAFGKMAEKAKTVQLGWDLELKGDPTADNHAVTKKYVDGKNRRYGIYGMITDYIEFIIPLHSLNNSNPSANFFCNGVFNMKRINTLGMHGQIRIVSSKNYNVSGARFFMNYDYIDGSSIDVVRYTNGGEYWCGLRFSGIGANFYDDCSYFEGETTTSWENNSISVIRIRNTNTGEILNTEVYNSMEVLSPCEDGHVFKNPVVAPYFAGAASALSLESTRPTSANVAVVGNGNVRHFVATSSMTEGKPAYDGHMLHFEWDNPSGYSGQLNIPTGGYGDETMQWRNMNAGTWQAWRKILDDRLVKDYPVAQGTSGIWRYIKFNSGIAMCWATSGNVSSAFSSTWGSLYVHDNLFPQQTYPFSFTDYPRVFASPFGLNGNVYTTGDYWIYSGTLGSPSISPAFSAARPTKPSATITICASILAIGMWR